jgi:hypothetical protein
MAVGPEEFRTPWLDGAYLDDELWHQAIATDARNFDRRGHDMTDDQRVLWRLINRGVIDHSDTDKRWDGSTRSMRYSAAMGDRLWRLLELETTRVGGPSQLFLTQLIETPRVIALNARSMN